MANYIKVDNRRQLLYYREPSDSNIVNGNIQTVLDVKFLA
jgi:hypothetical protein